MDALYSGFKEQGKMHSKKILLVIALVFTSFLMASAVYSLQKYMGNADITATLGGTDYRNYSDSAPAAWTSVIKYGKTAGKYIFDPAETASALTGNPDSGTPTGYGWGTNYVLQGAIPAGGWNFSVKITSSRDDIGYLGYVIYKRCSGVDTKLFGTFNSTDVLDGSGTATVYTHAYSASNFNVDGCYIKAEYWINVTQATSNPNADVTMTHDAASWIQFPDPDAAPPEWSGNTTNFTTLTYTENPLSIEFNVTWVDAISSVDTVLIEHNLTGTPDNYSVDNNAEGEYFYWWTGVLAAGDYVWKEYANDTSGNGKLNETDSFYFTVGKAASTIYLFANESRSNFQAGGGEDVNVTAILQNTSSVDIEIRTNYSDGVDKQWDTGASPLVNITALTVPGEYYFNASFPGDENYTWSNESWIVAVSQPYLEVNLTLPSTQSKTNVLQNYTFIVNASVTCRQGVCGTVNGTVRYNASGQNPDTPVSIIYAAVPVFVNESTPLAEKTCSTMGSGDSCNLSWVLNATGTIGEDVRLGVIFNGTSAGMLQNHTDNATISIFGCVTDITTTWSGIDFGELLPNTVGENASGNDAGLYNITVNPGSCNTDIYIKGVNLTNETFGSHIPIINFSWSSTANVYGSSFAMQETYVSLKSNVPQNTNVTTWYWLDVPPVYAGAYNGTIYVSGVISGDPAP